MSSTKCAFSRPLSNSARSFLATCFRPSPGESIFSSRASLGLIRIALSQLIFVIGSGHSCSQPLLMKRPSSTRASGTKRTSSASPVTAGCAPGVIRYPATAAWFRRTLIGGNAVFWTLPFRLNSRTPSCRNLVNTFAAFAPVPAVMVSKTSWCGSELGRTASEARTSFWVSPPKSGRIIGWIGTTVPSAVRASPQDSR